ncbi:DUF808 domain-containing protein [Caldichromatium japonicum]|uniref:DUF808 domain-containing protein n=1 Tax=Caldichromatium japonicum TaxID=2699430 RepID=A0A6G7VG54_9GAMM|nr:DUF808 domain-containing protein [Caldichromatium japonicum]QIK38890.1 DUF808 domain-containing protein [Caldichromatium japonicum]
MATSLLALLDDIASVLDDVALLTKAAAKKTSGVVGDDLAVNAEQVSGIRAERELPVIWAVAKGSAINKAILVPLALAISALAPWAVLPLLVLGGLYLCYEGVEKLAHQWARRTAAGQGQTAHGAEGMAVGTDAAALEQAKIRGAIRTDFVLSAEIIVIALGTVEQADLLTQTLVLSIVAVLMTLGVYGLVALIVKLDDLGLYLSQRPGAGWHVIALRRLGRVLLHGAPWLMRGLSVVGTGAMFLVGGSILAHALPLHHWLADLGPGWAGFATLFTEVLLGLAAGGAVFWMWQQVAERIGRPGH